MVTSKKVLLITRSFDKDNQLTIRHSRFVRYLNENYSLNIINKSEETWIYNSNSEVAKIFKKALTKILIFPDKDLLLLRKYKKEIKRKFSINEFDHVFITVFPLSLLKLAKLVRNLNKNCKITIDLSDPIAMNSSYLKKHFFMKKYLGYFENKYLMYINNLIYLNEEIKK